MMEAPKAARLAGGVLSQITGVDLDPARVAWCRALVPEGEFSSGDVRSCRLAATYDAVICAEVLEHLGARDRQAALHNLVGGAASDAADGATIDLVVPVQALDGVVAGKTEN